MDNTDTGIFLKIKNSDFHAYELLFRRYYRHLCGFAVRYLGRMEEAEEVVQDMFFTIWEKRETLNIHSSVKSYLFRAVSNRCIQVIDHKKVELKYADYFKAQEQEMAGDADEALRISELTGVVDKTMGQLPERCRKVFKMNRFEGLKYHEIAKKLSLSVKTIEADMGRALKLFRKNLGGYLETGKST